MKVMLSTGPGIGFATAERFAKEGFHVVLTARSAATVANLAARLKAEGYSAESRSLDAGDLAAVAELVAEVERKHGKIDVLHYNAASLRQPTLADQAAGSLLSELAVNIGGAMAAAKAAAPRMVERGDGAIFLTGGFFGLSPNPESASLSVGKAGVRNLALGLFESHRDKGVHVATVTVATYVNAGSKEAAEISEEYWKLYTQPQENWSAEVTYSG